MNAQRLTRRRRRPICQIRRQSTVDRLVRNVDELKIRCIRGADAENFCVGILKTSARGRANPIVLTDDRR